MTKESTPTLKFSLAAALAHYPKSVAADKRKEICEACGMTKETLSRIENTKSDEERDVPHTWVVKMCRIAGIELKKFINP